MASGRIHYAWITLAGTCVMMAVGFGMTLDAVGVFFPAVSGYLGTGTGPVASYMTIQGFSMVAGMAFAGKVIPKCNYNHILLAAALILSGGFIAMSFFTSLWQWYLAAIPMGLAIAFTAPVPISIIISNWFEKKRGLASGIAFAFSGIAGALLIPLGNHVILAYGWRTGYLVYGIIAGVLLVPTALFVIRKSPEEKKCLPYGASASDPAPSRNKEGLHVVQYGVTFHSAVRRPAFYMCILCAVFLTWGGAIHQHFPTHAMHLGLSVTHGAMMSTVVMAVQLIANVPLGLMADRFGVGKATLLFSSVAAVGSILLAFSTNLAVLYIGSFCYGVGVCQTIVVTSLLTRSLFGRKDYGQIHAVVMMFFGVTGAMTHMANGFLSDYFGSYTVPFVMTASASLLAIVSCNVAVYLERDQVRENRRMEGMVLED